MNSFGSERSGKIFKRRGSSFREGDRREEALGNKGPGYGLTLGPLSRLPAFVALAGSCIPSFPGREGFPIPVSVGASLMIVFFWSWQGHSKFCRRSPGFFLMTSSSLAGSVFFLHRLHHEEFDRPGCLPQGLFCMKGPGGGRVILVGTSRGEAGCPSPPLDYLPEGDEVDIGRSDRTLREVFRGREFRRGPFLES